MGSNFLMHFCYSFDYSRIDEILHLLSDIGLNSTANLRNLDSNNFLGELFYIFFRKSAVFTLRLLRVFKQSNFEFA